MIKSCLKELSLKNRILAGLCLLSVISCIIVTLTYGRTVVNSDMAIASLFADSFFRNHSFFSETWSYANGDIWTLYPSVGVLSILVHPIFGNGDGARTLVVTIQLIIGAITLIMFSRKYYKDESWTLMTPLGTMYLSGIALYILYDGCYGDFIIWQPLVCMLFINLYCKLKDRKYLSVQLALYVLLLYVLSIRGPRTVAEFALPMIIVVVVMTYLGVVEHKKFDWKTDALTSGYLILCNLIPAVFGVFTYNWLAKWHNINNVKESLLVFSGSMQDVWNGFIKTILFYFEVFGFEADVSVVSVYGLRNFISIIICAIICIIVPILQAKRLVQENKIVQFMFIYTIAHNVIMLLCGTFFDFVIKYHMTSSVILFVIISSRYIYIYWINQENSVRAYVWVVLFVIASLIEIIALLSPVHGWREKLEEKEKVAVILEQHGLTKGYATFWNAYSNQLYSDGKIRFGAVTLGQDRLQEYWWLVDNTIYSEENTKSFIMLTDEELGDEYDYQTILYGYEMPIEEFVIEDAKCYNDVRLDYTTNLHVYVYADDYAKYLVNGSDDGVVTPDEMFFNGLGERTDEYISLSNGGLIYGPYSNLDKGDYMVTYVGANLAACEEIIMSEYNPDDFDYEVVDWADNYVTLHLKVKSRVGGIQYRIQNNGDDLAVISKILVERQ